jgi:PAS domain-containing protein
VDFFKMRVKPSRDGHRIRLRRDETAQRLRCRACRQHTTGFQTSRACSEETASLLARYTDLFDFAPVGYFNLGADGTLRLVNLTGAKLAGVDRAQLLGRRLGLLVSPFDRRAFSDFIDRVFTTDTKQTCEVSLASDGRPPVRFWMRPTPT